MALGIYLALKCDECGHLAKVEMEDPCAAERLLIRGGQEGPVASEVRCKLACKGWRWIDGRDLCESCSRGLVRAGFTLVELLAVLAIVGIVAVVATPVVSYSIRGRSVHAAAEGLRAAITAAREAALRDRASKGLRIAPDASWALARGGDGRIDGAKALAGGRIVPMSAGEGYSAGRATVDVGPLPVGFAKPAAPLLLEQALRDPDGQLLEPTSWAWNVRVGDRIRVGGQNADYWVVGPEHRTAADGNVERFVNYPPAGTGLDRGDGPREYLLLVNGVDDDGDGRVDNGFNGLDDDLNGVVDDASEWAEVEAWHQPHRRGATAEAYELVRRPIPTAGPAVEMGAAVVDLTGWGLTTRPRSRAPVDPWTGAVELLVHPDGRIEPAIAASTPAALGMKGDWIHLWIADRSDVEDSPRLEGDARLVSIHGRTGRVAVTEIDPEDPGAAFRAAEGGGR